MTSSFPRSESVATPLAQAVRGQLRTRRLGRPLEGHRTLGSTNERARAWAADGAPEGSTVLADHQTAGRGRHGRRWVAQAGQNLTFSVILRPGRERGRGALPARLRGLIALAGGLAVCDAVAEAAPPLAPRLKWPNDVLLGGAKCCGVLAETSTGAGDSAVVLGVGLNVNQRAFADVPEGGATPPTSLALAAGRPIERAPLLARLLRDLETRYLSLFEDGGRAVRAAVEAHLPPAGTRLVARRAASDTRVEGALAGLAPSGALRLRTADGERVVHAGDVTLR